MQEALKGTVTPLASLFPPEEALKASKRVQDVLADRQSELDRLQGFIADNTALVNLVQHLPDELHHDIMACLQYIWLLETVWEGINWNGNFALGHAETEVFTLHSIIRWIGDEFSKIIYWGEKKEIKKIYHWTF